MTSSLLDTYTRAPLSFVKGEGAWLECSEGQRYLDFGTGIAVNSLGHAHPKLISALCKQAKSLWHTSNLYQIPIQEQLAQKLVEHTFADKVFFTNSGTESIECAIKMARKYHFEKGNSDKNKIVSFEGSFHGRSMAAISAASSNKLTNGFGPLLSGFKNVPFGDHDALIAAISEDTCAVIIEPIQGEGGIRKIPENCLKGLQEICSKQNALLIFDEVQSGIGRSGEFFAYNYSEVTPDIVAVAKGIGGGFPLGCCLATNNAASGMTSGTHGSTFGGNPLACAVGLAVLKEILSDGFLNNVKIKGRKLRLDLEKLVVENPLVFESVRGEGLMLGLKCKLDNSQIIQSCYEELLLLVPAGDNVIRVLPPLNVTDYEIDEAINRLKTIAYKIKV